MLNNAILIEKNTLAEKQCSVCRQVLPIFEFRKYKNKSGTFGYRGSCRVCEKARERKRYRREKAPLTIDNENADIFRFSNFYKKVKGG